MKTKNLNNLVFKRVSEDEAYSVEIETSCSIIDGLLKLMDCEYLNEWYDGNIIDFVCGEFGEDDSILIIKNDGTVIDITTSIKEKGFDFHQTIKKYLEGNDLNIITKITVKESFSEITIEREYEDGDRLIEVIFDWFDIEDGEFELYCDNDIKKLVRNRIVEEDDTFYLVGVEGELELELDKLEYKDFNKTLKELYWESM